jgi:hypothetical protein
MSKPALGIVVGAVLGALDGLSAWLSPEARPIIVTIVVGSTLKGIVTGALAGLIARRWQSTGTGVLAGLAIGFVLSTLAAWGQPGHYLEIVLPGMLVGGLVGFVTQRYPRSVAWTRSTRTGSAIALAAALSPALLVASQEATTAKSDTLAPLAGLVGRWSSATEGQPGKGTVEREYHRVFQLEEIFEPAEPGKDFAMYSRSRLTRAR